jgi:hypothetical protein
MAVTMKNGVFWDVTPCGSCKKYKFLRSVCVPSSPILVTLMMVALSSSEMPVLTRTTWHNIPEDASLHYLGICKERLKNSTRITIGIDCESYTDHLSKYKVEIPWPGPPFFVWHTLIKIQAVLCFQTMANRSHLVQKGARYSYFLPPTSTQPPSSQLWSLILEDGGSALIQNMVPTHQRNGVIHDPV